MPKCRRACVFAVVMSVIIAFVSGCGEVSEGERKKSGAGKELVEKQGGRLIIGMQQEPEILNEAVNSMVSVVYVCNLIFSKFVKHNQKMELIPDLITEIPTLQNGGISENFLVYTYHLRKDARWHDGVPVTSADVKFTWEVMMHPAINVETRQGWDIVDRVDTPDSFTVVFNLSKVYANFAGDCFYDESVLPRHLLEDKLGPDFQSDPFHRSPVGSGPFIFQEWVPGSHIVVKANPAYYGTGPYLDEIVVQFVPSGNALLMQLEAGSVMGIDNAPQELLSLARRLKGVKIYRNPALFNEHIDLNCENPILQDGRVRRALAMAVDRDELSRKIYDGVWVPAWGDEHPDSPYYSPVGREKYAFDPQKAAKLLSESGWIDRDGDGIREKDGKNLTLRISSTAGRLNRERTEVVLKEQFRRLGVELVIKNYHPSVLYASYDEGGILKNGKFDLALYAFLTPPDPSTKEGSYSIDFIPPTGQNNSRLRNRKLTELLAQGSRTVEFSRRKEIYDQVQAILAEEVPIIPLLWVTQLDVMPEKLRGYAPNPTQSGDTWNAAQWWMDR